MLALDYDYYPNDLPSSITETGSTVGVGMTITTTFAYDRLRRLTQEQRCRGTTSCDFLYYSREYVYDAGGNRTHKFDYLADERVEYTYDNSDPTRFGSFNNRLMQTDTYTTDSTNALLATTWYYYSAAGNVTRIVSDPPRSGGGVYAASTPSGTAGTAVDGSAVAPAADGGTVGTTVEGTPEATALPRGGSGCPVGQSKYTATRFEYAKNGDTVTYVLGEQWCWDGVSTDQNCGPGPVLDPTTNYKVLWAREFRYDGARARYMNRKLSADLFTDLGTTWSDYDGDEIYGDFTVTGTTPTVTNTDQYEPGSWRNVGGVADYLQNDHLGTLRMTTGTTGSAGDSRVFTAFGEPITQSGDRFGYVGAWGYQSNPIPESPNPDTAFPYLHVGARYYDPSSGRFLQRDPIGIRGGLNVYAYANSNPTSGVDPDGLFTSLNSYTVARAGLTAGDLLALMGEVAPRWAMRQAAIGAAKGLGVGIVAACAADVITDAFPLPWEWRGPPDKGSWHNPTTGESLRPDLTHGPPLGPHWDYTAPDGSKWRIFPNGTIEPTI